MYRKLGVSSRSEAVARARELGLLDLQPAEQLRRREPQLHLIGANVCP